MSKRTTSVKITFRDLEPSPAVESLIHDYVDKLATFSDDILSCRVTVEIPHRHHQHGNRYHIGVHLAVPGDQVDVRHQPAPKSGEPPAGRTTGRPALAGIDTDLQVAIHEAFDIARRQLRDWVRRRRGRVKRHDATP